MTATLTEPTTTNTLTPCRGMAPGDHCHREADLIITTHTATNIPVCWRCWDADRDAIRRCPVAGRGETRDQHARIVRWVPWTA